MGEHKKGWRLDPRTGLALLVLSNIFAFTQNAIWLECSWIASLGILMLSCRYPAGAVKWLAGFAAILCLQMFILPNSPKAIATAFSIFTNYARRMYPCLMVGSLMIKKISLREMIVGLRELHFPQKLIISLSITLRYLPAVREEIRHIHDAMKLHHVQGFEKIEAVIVPLIVSATTTAEELSAAAVTRGIENPVRKTSIIQLRLSWRDYFFMFLFVVFTLTAFMAK